MIDRVLVGSDINVTSPYFVDLDEEAVELTDDPAVTVTSRVTGDTLTTPSVAASATDGLWVATLTADDHTGTLDVLDVTWTGTHVGGTITVSQEVQVVGGFYVSIPELRTIALLSDTTAKPAAQLRRWRASLENTAEEARGVAYVHRVAIETHTRGPVRVREGRPSQILAISIDGADKTPGDYKLDPLTRTLTTSTGCTVYYVREVVVAYVHGYASPPQNLAEACREYVRAKVTQDSTNVNRNASSVTNLATQEVYRFGTADPRYSRWTGIESVDALINMVPDERVLIG